MKNIHILPTNKPSRLWLDEFNVLRHGNESFFYESGCTWQNIYITSDERIREDWYLNLTLGLAQKSIDKDYLKGCYESCKKIILTTDQDLIKDGIQPIPDEFLEWFVKNSSCEGVEIDKFPDLQSYNETTHKCNLIYKITIPKEEPNPCKRIEFKEGATIDVPFGSKHIRFENLTTEQAGYLLQVSEFHQLSSNRKSTSILTEEPKQETLELKYGNQLTHQFEEWDAIFELQSQCRKLGFSELEIHSVLSNRFELKKK